MGLGLGPDDYNYEHFGRRHVAEEVGGFLVGRGVGPGALAPDFELPAVGGGTVRLVDRRDRPVLLHFGSYTWPVAVGSVEPLKGLHRRWGEVVHFVDVMVRQVHPGPAVPPYRSEAQKMADAEAYRRDEGIPWTVLVDDIEGSVHQAYGGLANPAYLIGTDGRVCFYGPTTGVPSLHRALDKLVGAGGRGIVAGGRDVVPHLLATVTDGWPAIERGLPQSAAELSSALPGSVALLRLGARLRPVLAPLTLRPERLSRPIRLALIAGAIGVLLSTARAARRGHPIGVRPGPSAPLLRSQR